MSLGIGIVNPKKRREIEGVGSGSMMDLKATLFRAQEDAKHVKLNPGTSSGASRLLVKAPVSKNKGVDARSKRDEEELQKILDPSAVLEEKMAKYRAMVQDGFRDEKEQFLVDFEQKKWDGAANQPEIPNQGDECARRLEEQVRSDLQAATEESTMKQSASDLKAKRLEAARKRIQLARAAPPST